MSEIEQPVALDPANGRFLAAPTPGVSVSLGFLTVTVQHFNEADITDGTVNTRVFDPIAFGAQNALFTTVGIKVPVISPTVQVKVFWQANDFNTHHDEGEFVLQTWGLAVGAAVSVVGSLSGSVSFDGPQLGFVAHRRGGAPDGIDSNFGPGENFVNQLIDRTMDFDDVAKVPSLTMGLKGNITVAANVGPLGAGAQSFSIIFGKDELLSLLGIESEDLADPEGLMDWEFELEDLGIFYPIKVFDMNDDDRLTKSDFTTGGDWEITQTEALRLRNWVSLNIADGEIPEHEFNAEIGGGQGGGARVLENTLADRAAWHDLVNEVISVVQSTGNQEVWFPERFEVRGGYDLNHDGEPDAGAGDMDRDNDGSVTIADVDMNDDKLFTADDMTALRWTVLHNGVRNVQDSDDESPLDIDEDDIPEFDVATLDLNDDGLVGPNSGDFIADETNFSAAPMIHLKDNHPDTLKDINFNGINGLAIQDQSDVDETIRRVIQIWDENGQTDFVVPSAFIINGTEFDRDQDGTSDGDISFLDRDGNGTISAEEFDQDNKGTSKNRLWRLFEAGGSAEVAVGDLLMGPSGWWRP